MVKEVAAKTTPFSDTCVPDDFSGGFMHVIHMLYVGIQKHLEGALSAHGQMSFSQFVILVAFSHGDKPCMNQATLAEHLTLTEATVSRHITTLVAMGLLSKEKDPHSNKAYNISITPLGEKAFLSAKTIIMKELDALFSHINDKDKATIIKNFTETISILHQKK